MKTLITDLEVGDKFEIHGECASGYGTVEGYSVMGKPEGGLVEIKADAEYDHKMYINENSRVETKEKRA